MNSGKTLGFLVVLLAVVVVALYLLRSREHVTATVHPFKPLTDNPDDAADPAPAADLRRR